MKRRQFIYGAGLGLAATAVAKPAIAQSAPALKWRCTSSFAKPLDILYGAAEVFAKAVADFTDNKFQIQVFAAGELVPGLQALDAVAKATVEMCHTASYYYVAKDPTFVFGTAVPFGLNARMQNAWYMFGGGMELMNEFYKQHNVYAIPCGNTGCQMGGWFRKDIKSSADLNGLKFRIGGYAARVLQRLGCVPQQVAGSDIYSALERGAIDAAAWVGPYDDEKLGLQKVAPFYHYPAWWDGGAVIQNFINLEKWNALTPTYQTIVRSACETANAWMLAKYDASNPAALKRLIAAGAKPLPFPTAVLDDCLTAALDVCRDVALNNGNFKKVWDAMLAYRNDQYLWWQVAEYTNDTTVIRNRTRA
jgi:TRAP-type mannitol/chloroaromatic compound transport system substrate-binding protein